jgi:hypothetical protein
MYNHYKDNTVILYVDYEKQTGNIDVYSNLILTDWVNNIFQHFKTQNNRNLFSICFKH